MHLAEHTLRTVEFDKIRSLLADRCGSPMGRIEIETLTPIDDPDHIQVRLRPVMECMDLIAFGEPLSLHRIPDIRPTLASSTAAGAQLGIKELLEVADVLQATHRLQTYMNDRRDRYPKLWQLSAGLTPSPDTEQAIHHALDPTTETVKDSASRELRRIRRMLESQRARIREQVEQALAKLPDSVVQDRLVTVRDGRFVIPIRENQKNRVQGLVHDQSASGATLFVEPLAVVALNNEIRQLELDETREVRRILRELTAAIGQIAAALRENLDILGKFDAIYAKASFGRDLNATEPLLNTQGRIVLRQARHPLLVYRLRRDNAAQDLVPLDLSMGETFNTLILTGPNAGGKTVALKTIGLLALMAQAGLPIPAQEKSELPIFSGIFADIGDDQSIENDLSTFSSHVRNLIGIAEKADDKALILLDEIGASTDPDEGSALAVALLQTFTARGCHTLATTHHGALKAVAHSTPGMANGSMAFDADTLRPTFHMRVGIPGSSYAFEIAARLGMPPEIIAEARTLAGSDVRRVESLILDLDATHQRYTESLKQSETERAELNALLTDYQTRLKDVESRERHLRQNAQEEAQRILAEANALVERTVREIRESQASKSVIKKAHTELEKARQANQSQASQQPAAPAVSLKPGDRVWSRTFEQEGRVVTAPNRSGRLMVEIGNVKMELQLRDLEPRQRTTDPGAPQTQKRKSHRGRSHAAPEIDVRGHTFDEASDIIDRYIDEALMARLGWVRIIHGKGTGALKKKLTGFFDNHPHVKSQRAGEPAEGGWGVTILELNLDD